MLWMWMLWGCAKVPDPPNNGRLAPCWSSPNCVSTMADSDDAEHYVAPLPWAAGLEPVVEGVRGLPGCVVITHDDAHLLAECTTPSGAFTDDLHVLLVDGALHLRSSSRLGYGDLGVNRARVQLLQAALSSP